MNEVHITTWLLIWASTVCFALLWSRVGWCAGCSFSYTYRCRMIAKYMNFPLFGAHDMPRIIQERLQWMSQYMWAYWQIVQNPMSFYTGQYSILLITLVNLTSMGWYVGVLLLHLQIVKICRIGWSCTTYQIPKFAYRSCNRLAFEQTTTRTFLQASIAMQGFIQAGKVFCWIWYFGCHNSLQMGVGMLRVVLLHLYVQKDWRILPLRLTCTANAEICNGNSSCSTTDV